MTQRYENIEKDLQYPLILANFHSKLSTAIIDGAQITYSHPEQGGLGTVLVQKFAKMIFIDASYVLALFYPKSETNHLINYCIDRLSVTLTFPPDFGQKHGHESTAMSRQIFGKIRDTLLNESTKHPANRRWEENYELKNGILYRIINRALLRNLILCLPSALRDQVLTELHEPTHCRVLRTYLLFKSRYYTSGIQQYIAKRIRSCHSCNLCKFSPTKDTIATQRISVSGLFDGWSLDCIRKLKDSKDGHRYIYVVREHLSGFNVSQDVKELTTATIISFITDNTAF